MNDSKKKLTPSEKAEELYKKHLFILYGQVDILVGANLRRTAAKEALVTCEVAREISWWSSSDMMPEPYCLCQKEYWDEVTEELKAKL